MNTSDSTARSSSPPRGRPRSKKKRREIMTAAVELFTEKGFVATSVDDIALAAGVSKQTVYSHYGSKENLFALAVSSKCKSSGMDPDMLDPDIPPEVLLPELVGNFMQLVLSRESMRVHSVCAASTETHPELGHLFYQHGPLHAVQVLAEYLDEQNTAGRLRIDNPENAAWQLLCMLKAEAFMHQQFGLEPISEGQASEYFADCVAMFLRAYAP